VGQIFRYIEQGIGWLLSFYYDLIPSFGLAIILLTITINLLLFPLTLKQTRSTRAFQAVAPEIKRIQKELKEEPEKMQKELMRVQKEAGATPGGCLGPILVQMPIWFALFRVLQNVSLISNGTSVEAVFLPSESALLAAVKGGPQRFLGMDLALNMSSGIRTAVFTALPYVVMLVLMIATQYFQMWHAQRGSNASSHDLTAQQRQQQQTQQAITRFMPVMLGFVSWNFPAGLVLYWTTSNLFRLGQQFVIFAIDGRPHPAPVASVEKGKEAAPAVEGSKKPHPVSAKKQQRRKRR
jgi:YidC/Oxa1 family membrane protein insertase